MFQHVREGNRLAHSLAKNAVLSADTDVWIKLYPKMWKTYSNQIYLELVLFWCWFLIIFRLHSS